MGYAVHGESVGILGYHDVLLSGVAPVADDLDLADRAQIQKFRCESW